jgi:hypothetical protein
MMFKHSTTILKGKQLRKELVPPQTYRKSPSLLMHVYTNCLGVFTNKIYFKQREYSCVQIIPESCDPGHEAWGETGTWGTQVLNILTLHSKEDQKPRVLRMDVVVRLEMLLFN